MPKDSKQTTDPEPTLLPEDPAEWGLDEKEVAQLIDGARKAFGPTQEE